MRISSVTVTNFRCFGPSPTTVSLTDGITALIGANGAGKTALLLAMTRMFGVTSQQRMVVYSDFHQPKATAPNDRATRDLAIEVVLEFPELANEDAEAAGVAPAFHQMIVDGPGEPPYCRIRLEATWIDDGTADGSVEQRLWWLLSAEAEPADEDKRSVRPRERAMIQAVYAPADRDPADALRYAAQTGLGRFIHAVRWSGETRDAVEGAAKEIDSALDQTPGVVAIKQAISATWQDLADSDEFSNAHLRFTSIALDELIRSFDVTFSPASDSSETPSSRLSDGQRSLLYLSLVAATSDLERQIASSAILGASTEPAFQDETLRLPSLTIVLLEEPENHLAPHYLSRIIELFESSLSSITTQVVLSSHSPAIVGRVDPSDLRHFRLDLADRTTSVQSLTLPSSRSEEERYVREAVRAFPELYFADFVILAEGPSETQVLPKLATAADLALDQSLVAVVPLGGRHVNHMWKLLTSLGIPHATLLDLDAGRQTGGWDRIRYICDQLLANGKPDADIFRDAPTETLNGDIPLDLASLEPWCQHLENFGVFLSWPLDFDLLMLQAFPTVYGDDNLKDSNNATIETAIAGALGNADNNGLYHPSPWESLFPKYRRLFSRGKPAAHLLATSQLDEDSIGRDCPEVIKRLLHYCQQQLSQKNGST